MGPPESVRACVCVLLGISCHNEYICTCQLLMPTSTYPLSCRHSAHVQAGPSQTAVYPPILPQPRRGTSRRQTGTLHLLEKPEARYRSAPCSQRIPVHHNVPQCAGSLIGQTLAIWWVVLLQKVIKVFFLYAFSFFPFFIPPLWFGIGKELIKK